MSGCLHLHPWRKLVEGVHESQNEIVHDLHLDPGSHHDTPPVTPTPGRSEYGWKHPRAGRVEHPDEGPLPVQLDPLAWQGHLDAVEEGHVHQE